MRIFKYQFTILFPKKRAIKVPTTKNGPKGTLLFKLFLPAKINPIPIIAPIENAKNKATKTLGKFRKRPIKKVNLTSPKPNHLPRERRKIKRKKMAAAKALYIVLSIGYEVLSRKYEIIL